MNSWKLSGSAVVLVIRRSGEMATPVLPTPMPMQARTDAVASRLSAVVLQVMVNVVVVKLGAAAALPTLPKAAVTGVVVVQVVSARATPAPNTPASASTHPSSRRRLMARLRPRSAVAPAAARRCPAPG